MFEYTLILKDKSTHEKMLEDTNKELSVVSDDPVKSIELQERKAILSDNLNSFAEELATFNK
jgi:hypothetical protein